jgi:hypothetical protein
MANTIDLLINTNGVTVLNQTADAAGKTAKGFTSAKAELRALNQQLLQMDASSEEFKKASARAAELKDNISDLGAEINANAGNAFEGLSNNVGLFGSRLMNLDLKGAGQALSGMGSAVGRIDFKTLKDEVGGLAKGLGNLGKAVLGNPFFLAAGALIAMVVYWEDIKNAVKGTAENVEKLTSANEGLERQNKILEAKLNIEKISNANSSYAIKLQKEIATNNIKAAQNELDIKTQLGDINGIREAENKLIEARNFLTSITAQQEKDRQGAIDYARSILYKGYKEQLENAKQQQLIETQRVATADLIKQKQDEIGGLRIQESLQIQQVNKEEEKQYKNFVQTNNEQKKNYVEKAAESDAVKAKQAELNKLIQEEADLKKVSAMLWNGELLKVEEVNKIVKEGIKEQKDAVVEIDNSAAEEFRAAYNAINEIAAQQSKENELRLLSDKDKELQINKEKYDALIAEANLRGLDTKVFLDAQLAEEDAIKKKWADKEKDEAQKLEEDKRKLALDTANARLEIAQQGLTALTALGDAYFSSQLANVQKGSKAELDLKKKQFAFNKKMQIGGAIMDTAKAITAAIAANPFPSPTLPVSIALASITGAAQIAKIASTKFDGGGGGGGGVNIPTTGADGTTAPSPANFAFLQNQPNQQPPLQAYVVGTQVSSNLEAQQLIQNQSRLGG